jgi:hypothetical protein
MCQQGRQRFVVRSLIHSPREKVLHLFRFMWKTFISLVRFILPLVCSSGDSGGPLFRKGDNYGEDELVGTVAWYVCQWQGKLI